MRDKKNLENVVSLSQRKNLFLEIVNCAKYCCSVEQMGELNYVRFCNMEDKSNFGEGMKTRVFLEWIVKSIGRECWL